MADTTTPITPPAQDLQINLEEAPKVENITTPGNTSADLDLSLDLNLPEAPKNDDRLKTEDQKNNETVTIPVIEPVIKKEMTEQSEGIPQGGTPTVAEPIAEIPVKAEEIVIPEAVQPVEKKIEVPTETVEQPSTVVETITSSSSDNLQKSSENNPQLSSLKEDMKMIDELEGHASAGGLAQEATVAPQSAPAEAPKTFDLDAMLGGPTMPPVIEATQPIQQATIDIPMPTVTATPMETPAFTIPTTTTQVPVQAVIQTHIPKKNAGVKVLMFVVLFAALGFTTFFILKTMYPVEFGNIFGGQTQMHASENITGTIEELTGTELTGTTEDLSGTIDTGTGIHESAVDNGFGELNDLGTTTAEPEQTDLSRLTDYVTQGNDFLAQGKAMSNNTVIKYGLYISKKATTFLEKIANGEEINNLSGYFAQFDQYIEQLKILVGETPNSDTTVTTPDEEVSAIPPTNDLQEVTDTSTSITDTGTTSQ